MSSPSKFPTFQLPKGPLELVLGSMSYMDIVELSQTSKLARDLIKSNPHLWTETGIYVEFNGWQRLRKVTLQIDNDTEPVFGWAFKSDRQTDKRPEAVIQRSYDGVKMDLASIWCGSYWSTGSDEHLLFWVQFLMDLFSVPIRKVSLNTYGVYFDFEKYFEKSDVLHKSEEFFIEDGGFSHEEMDFMLDNFKTAHFYCKGYPGKSFKPLNPISFELIQLKNAVWVDPEVLENLTRNSELIRIRDTSLTSQQINEFIKKWLSEGSDWKFRDLSIKVKKYTSYQRIAISARKFAKRKILVGINRNRGSKKDLVAEKRYLDRDADYENGLDIERNDGVKATIRFKCGEGDFTFMMTVWN